MRDLSRQAKKYLIILTKKLTRYSIDPAVVDSYERSEFGHGWKDFDRDGEDARAEVLIQFNRSGGKANLYPIVKDGNRVVSGRWWCRFSQKFYTDASEIDIDHLVPLKEAWVSGAHTWTDEQREKYANGLGIKSKKNSWLLPVCRSLNRSKGSKRPDQWLPPVKDYHVQYACAWIHAKRYWTLGVIDSEYATLKQILESKIR